MAVNFVTGLPRHGKTLWTLCTVKERAEREKRQVYTCNIPGITIPGWLEIEHPDLWLTLPHGSIIIVDELQDFWQKEASGMRVPGPILELSKHGKRGLDFYFITQEPNLVHATPRDLCQHHYYVVRAFGSHNATVRKFERMQLHPEKVKKTGDMTPWRYPKEAFTWYKSADVHNIKRQIPMKVKLIPVMLLFVVLCLWAAFKFASSTLDKAKSPGAVSGLPGQSQIAQPGQPAPGATRQAAPVSKAEYVSSFVPRVEGLPYTAPRYDPVTTPVTAPFPAACISMGKRCSCYSQQGTALDTSHDICEQIAHKGFFMDWSPGGQQVAQAAPAARSEPLQAGNSQNALPVTVAQVVPVDFGPSADPPLKQYLRAPGR